MALELNPKYLVDGTGARVGVLLDLEQWRSILAELEDLEDIETWEAAKAEFGDALPWDEAKAEIERERGALPAQR